MKIIDLVKRINLESYEKRILGWALQNRYRLLSLGLALVLLFASKNLPYFNLFLKPGFIFVLVLSLIIFILDINTKLIILLLILSFIPCPFFVLIGEPELAEYVGNFIYSIFIVTIIKSLLYY